MMDTKINYNFEVTKKPAVREDIDGKVIIDSGLEHNIDNTPLKQIKNCDRSMYYHFEGDYREFENCNEQIKILYSHNGHTTHQSRVDVHFCLKNKCIMYISSIYDRKGESTHCKLKIRSKSIQNSTFENLRKSESNIIKRLKFTQLIGLFGRYHLHIHNNLNDLKGIYTLYIGYLCHSIRTYNNKKFYADQSITKRVRDMAPLPIDNHYLYKHTPLKINKF